MRLRIYEVPSGSCLDTDSSLDHKWRCPNSPMRYCPTTSLGKKFEIAYFVFLFFTFLFYMRLRIYEVPSGSCLDTDSSLDHKWRCPNSPMRYCPTTSLGKKFEIAYFVFLFYFSFLYEAQNFSVLHFRRLFMYVLTKTVGSGQRSWLWAGRSGVWNPLGAR